MNSRVFALFAAVMAFGVLPGCDDDPVTPTTGSIEVTITTTGDGSDEDGYVVSLDDGEETEEADVDDTVTFAEVDTGSHTVELTDLAEGCTVDGDNPETVTVDSDEETTMTFEVTCTAA